MGTDGVRKEYKPTSKQRKAHEAKETYILFGGAVGGSKSTFICNEVIQHCLKYPGARVYLARHELTSFKKTTYLTLMEFLPMNFITKHNRSECFIEFFNGSRIFYGGLGDDVRAIERLKSMEISAYAVDQAEETTEAFFHMLNSRLRLKIPGVKYKGWLTCNPTGGWLRSRFIDKQIEDHRFIPAKITDNPYLPSNYEENLRKTLPEELVKAWIEGNWDVIASENTVFKFDQVMAAKEIFV
jgi:phage terminase large subunit